MPPAIFVIPGAARNLPYPVVRIGKISPTFRAHPRDKGDSLAAPGMTKITGGIAAPRSFPKAIKP